jgi:hypothetical protein
MPQESLDVPLEASDVLEEMIAQGVRLQEEPEPLDRVQVW